MSPMLSVLLIALLAFVVNIPLGRLRHRSPRYSARWFLYVHLSVPFIIAARLYSQLDWKYVPVFIAAAVAGQYLGGRMGTAA